MHKKNNKNIIFVDLDNTLTIPNLKDEYIKHALNTKLKKCLQKIKKKQSYKIVIFTARGMKSNNEDKNLIKKNVLPVIIKWLAKHKVNYDEIKLFKPYCGENGWYVDDRNLTLQQFIFKFSGPFSNKNFDIVIPCFNEELNISKINIEIENLQKYLNINKVLMVNNGSTDRTKDQIKKLLKRNSIYKLINIKNNIGYGNGVVKGIKNTTSDLIMIVHGDLQYKPSDFISINIDQFEANINNKLVCPIRINRPISNIISTLILRIFISLITFKYIKEFNGQPKIFRRNDVIKKIDNFPLNYCFDLALYLNFKDKIFLPTIEKRRKYGISSWLGFPNKIRVFYKFIEYAILWKIRN